MESLGEFLQDPAYRHVVLNHFPITGLLVAWVVLVVGLVIRQRETSRVGLVLVAPAAVSLAATAAIADAGGKVRHAAFRGGTHVHFHRLPFRGDAGFRHRCRRSVRTRQDGDPVTARIVAAILIAGVSVLLVPAPVAAQAGGAWTAPRTAWGHPDLQGIWSNTMTTPMERPADLAGREFLTEEERAERAPGAGLSAEERSEFMPTGGYNDFWLEKGDLASWEDFSTYDRCLTRGMPGAMTPGFYNHNYQILRTPDYVAILVEMIHDVRIVPLDGSVGPPAAVGQWLGRSTGRWEGDTLVIETTNLQEDDRRVVERLTRTAADTIDYRVTVTDEAEWTGPWTALMPMTAIEGPLFEYACHEGNYSLPNMLAGKRAEEAR